jgi:mannose-6-phosphate isomerase-like protein (cupin superfamily)
MNRSWHAWTCVPMLLVLVGVCLVLPSRIDAQAPPAAELPKTVTVSPGPNTNLYKHVMKKAEILAALAQVKDSWDLVVKSNVAITLRAAANTTKQPWKNHVEADELWFVYRGAAKVSLAPFSLMVGVTPPGDTHDVGEGDIVNVPRGMAYQIMPAGGRFEYVAVRRFAVQVPSTGSGRGTGTPPAPLPPVTTKAQLDQFFTTATASSSLNGGINRIVYNGKPGPAENHELDEHVYFVQHGTAKATMDGYVTNPYWDRRGLMGTGVVGGSEYTIGPGDMVFVFRNTVHYIEPMPASSKVGYLLVDLPESEAYWPKSIVPNGTGAY